MYTMHASEDFLTFDLENSSLNKVLLLQQILKIHKNSPNKTKAKRWKKRLFKKMYVL